MSEPKINIPDCDDLIKLVDIALKHPEFGGLKIAARAIVLTQKLQEHAKAIAAEIAKKEADK